MFSITSVWRKRKWELDRKNRIIMEIGEGKNVYKRVKRRENWRLIEGWVEKRGST